MTQTFTWKATAIEPAEPVRPAVLPLVNTPCWQCGHDALAVRVSGTESAIRHRSPYLDDCRSTNGVPK